MWTRSSTYDFVGLKNDHSEMLISLSLSQNHSGVGRAGRAWSHDRKPWPYRLQIEDPKMGQERNVSFAVEHILSINYSASWQAKNGCHKREDVEGS